MGDNCLAILFSINECILAIFWTKYRNLLLFKTLLITTNCTRNPIKSNDMFKRVENNINLAQVENEISNYWDEIDAFQTSLNNRKNDQNF